MAEDSEFDVNKEVKKTKEEYIKVLKEAFGNRKKYKKKPKTIKYRGDEKHAVFIEEKDSHLYPFVIREAYKTAGINNPPEALIKEELKHEHQHGVATPEGTNVYYGLAFYETEGRSYMHLITAIDKDLIGEEERDFTENPDRLSSYDKRDLKEILN